MYENSEKQICTIGKFEHTGKNSKNKLVIVHTVYSFHEYVKTSSSLLSKKLRIRHGVMYSLIQNPLLIHVQ